MSGRLAGADVDALLVENIVGHAAPRLSRLPRESWPAVWDRIVAEACTLAPGEPCPDERNADAAADRVLATVAAHEARKA